MDDGRNARLEELKRLAAEISRTLGVPPPQVLEARSDPSLQTAEWYLVGLIGGKEVGKSALINALVGTHVAETSSHGPGTERVLAYVHKDFREEVSAFLERIVPDRFDLAEHSSREVRRQVLLDLPDIDSRYEIHVELTRRFLGVLLYPVWVQSIEKYADLVPYRLLRTVAEGNSPENFLFCLNKIDQVMEIEGEDALEEVRRDYADRIVRNLNLEKPPKIYLVSALQTHLGDFPALRAHLSSDKPPDAIMTSRRLATNRTLRTLLGWIDDQRLPEKIERLTRIEALGVDLLSERVLEPLFSVVLPSIESDDSLGFRYRNEILNLRILHWPILRILHPIPASFLTLLRLGTSGITTDSASCCRKIVDRPFEKRKPTIVESLQSVFVRIRSLEPQADENDEGGGLWRLPEAEKAVLGLRRRLEECLRTRSERLRSRFRSPGGFCLRGWRFLVTYGALLWFPLGQPLLADYLETGTLSHWALTLVRLTGASHLLSSGGFLVFYFGFLWLFLKHSSDRKVDRILGEWNSDPCNDPRVSLRRQCLEWLDELLEPLRARRRVLENWVSETDRFRVENADCGSTAPAPSPDEEFT